MICNLPVSQILLIVLAIIILISIITWFVNKRKQEKQYPLQPIIQKPQPLTPSMQPINNNTPPLSPIQPLVGQQQHSESPYILYYFYSPHCPHCQSFNPIWKKTVDVIKQIKGLTVREIDGTKRENEDLSFYYNVERYPTLILVTPDKNIEYNGNRTVEDIYNFVTRNIQNVPQNYNVNDNKLAHQNGENNSFYF